MHVIFVLLCYSFVIQYVAIYEAFFCNPAPQWELMEFRASVKKYLHSLS